MKRGLAGLLAVAFAACAPLAHAPAQVRDRDEAAIAPLLASRVLTARDASLSENGLIFRIRTFSARAPGPSFLILHDDEQESFRAAAEWAAAQGGRVVALESGEARRISGVDPNRIFNARFPAFTAAITAFYPAKAPIITLHNNRDGYGTPESSISVRRWIGGDKIQGFDHGDDEDHLVWLAATAPLAENTLAKAHLAALKAHGINVVYEQVVAPGDGSLSNWAALQGRLYFNIEAEHGALARQKELLAAVMALDGVRAPGA